MEKRGYVNVPQSTGADMRAMLKRHGVVAAVEMCGLTRVSVLAIAAEATVQAATLTTAQEAIRRVQETGA